MLVKQIRELCTQNNITLAKLERELDFGNGTIRRWNENPPSIIRLLEVAEYFKVNVNDLIKKEGD